MGFVTANLVNQLVKDGDQPLVLCALCVSAVQISWRFQVI